MALLRLAFTVALAAAGQPIVTVTGGTACPTRAEVTARLGERLSRPATGGHGDVAELRDDGASIRVTLRSAEGNVIGQRTLPRTFLCADLAEAIGVVLETWETDVHPQFEVDSGTGSARRPVRPVRVTRAPGAPEFPPSAPPASAPVPSPAPAPLALAAAPPDFPTPRNTPAAPPERTRSAAAPPETVVRPAREAGGQSQTPAQEPAAPVPAIELLAGALGGLAQASAGTRTSLALGARVGVGWTSSRIGAPSWTDAWRRGWPDAWGAELGFLTTSERSTALPSGTANWRREVLTLDPHLRRTLGASWLTMELHAEGLAALLHLRGAGFSANGGGRSFDPGFGAGARLLFGRTRLQTWIDLRVASWIVSQVVYEQPSSQSEALPRQEGMLALGVSWSVRP